MSTLHLTEHRLLGLITFQNTQQSNLKTAKIRAPRLKLGCMAKGSVLYDAVTTVQTLLVKHLCELSID